MFLLVRNTTQTTTEATTAKRRDTHVTPPRARGPPECPQPHARLLHLAERALHCGDALRVVACTDLAEEALEASLLEPLRRGLKTLRTNRRRHTGRGRARAIGVEVLVHL